MHSKRGLKVAKVAKVKNSVILNQCDMLLVIMFTEHCSKYNILIIILYFGTDTGPVFLGALLSLDLSSRVILVGIISVTKCV